MTSNYSKGYWASIEPAKPKEPVSFEDWYADKEQWLTEYAAESGADRELDFNWGEFIEEEYEAFIKKGG
jgi:hypothetical protein